MKIKIFVFNPFEVNSYLLYDEKNAILVDAACYELHEKQEIQDFLNRHGLKLTRLINTHLHIDHILGNDYIHNTYGLLPEYHEAGQPFLIAAPEIARMYNFRLERLPDPGPALNEGDRICLGDSCLEVLYTPGHADGSVCLYNEKEKFVITGDVLFSGSIGRTDFPSGNLDTLMRSIREKLFSLPEDVVVYPGHGPSTTIGHEKRYNPFLV